MKALQNNRDLRLDALKMYLIILVIYAHIPLLDGLISGLRVECDTLMWHSVKGIYSFHMPLFVLLSGYFTKRKTVKNMFRSSLKLLKLFVVFHSIDLFLRYMNGGVSFSIRDIITPSFALWYLLCLFYWRLFVVLIPNQIARKYIVLFSVVLSLLVGFVHIRGELGFQRFFSFMPYFFIGNYYGKEIMSKIDSLVNRITPQQLILLLTALGLIVLASFNPRWLDTIVSPYTDLIGLPFRICFLGGSFLLCLLLLEIFKYPKSPSLNFMSKMGADTLFFYLIHPYVLYVIVMFLNNYFGHITILSAILITSLTIIILNILKKIKIIHFLLK